MPVMALDEEYVSGAEMARAWGYRDVASAQRVAERAGVRVLRLPGAHPKYRAEDVRRVLEEARQGGGIGTARRAK